MNIYNIEGLLVKKNSIVQIQEAFSSGSAASIVQKLGNILSRKINQTITFSDIPIEYQNSYGTFAGFIGATSSELYIKINFKLAGSDSIESFDVYLQGLEDTPTYTVDTSGLNIVQIVNLITENLIDDDEVSENSLQEKGPVPSNVNTPEYVSSVIEKWVATDKSIIPLLQKDSVPDIFNSIWNDWVNDKPNYASIKFYLFSKGLKNFLLSRGLSNKTYKPRKKGTRESQIKDPALAAQFDDIVESISWKEKFDFLDSVVQEMYNGSVQSIYVYGSPGCLSKDTTLKVRRENSEYQTYTIEEAYLQFNDKKYPIQVLSYNKNGLLTYKNIQDIIYSGKKEVFEVIVEDGKIIKATKDHKFYINTTYVSLDQLHVGDLVLTSNAESRTLYKKIVSITPLGIQDTYDITMEDSTQPNFLANDFVVHNSGKSYQVINTLDKLNANYKLYKGNVIKSVDDLIRILYNNREGTILVFDDADAALKKTDINIWKTILENSNYREITYLDIDRSKNKALSDIPPKFSFESGCIFISNSPKIDKALASRSIVLEINLSNEDMISKIKETLSNFRPEIDMNLKLKALEYMQEISEGVEGLDYRMMDNILISMKVNPKNWKKMSIWMMQSI